MHQLWAQNNPYIFNVNYQFSLFHSIQYLSQYNKAKGTIFFKRDYYVLSSDWRIIGLTPVATRLLSTVVGYLPQLDPNV